MVGGFKGQVRPKGPPHLALNPPHVWGFVFLGVCFGLFSCRREKEKTTYFPPACLLICLCLPLILPVVFTPPFHIHTHIYIYIYLSLFPFLFSFLSLLFFLHFFIYLSFFVFFLPCLFAFLFFEKNKLNYYISKVS